MKFNTEIIASVSLDVKCGKTLNQETLHGGSSEHVIHTNNEIYVVCVPYVSICSSMIVPHDFTLFI
jgi:hypothetical protein